MEERRWREWRDEEEKHRENDWEIKMLARKGAGGKEEDVREIKIQAEKVAEGKQFRG